ncbi:MAG: YgcG family protein [Burkholderiaceae bacterium]
MNTIRFAGVGTARWLCLLWLLALTAFIPSYALDGLVAVPPLQARLTDLTKTLTAEQQANLEQTLRAFETKKGTQIAVLIVPSTKPEEIEQYALRVVEQWKLGRKKVDDGALLLIAKDDRTLRIEVGYGLEGVLNDATAKRIVSEVITPPLSQGNYFGGVSAGVEQMIRVIDGEPLPEPKRGAAGATGQSIVQLWPLLFVVTLFLGSVLRKTLGRVPGALVVGGLLGLVGWLFAGAAVAAALAGAIAFLSTLLGVGVGGHGGMHGGGFYGGMGGGRSGGGSFGGGGGGFGGGGASGRF